MKRYGRLITDEIPIKRGKAYFYKCVCDCGNTSMPERNNLFSGKVISCGCYRNEQASRRVTKHSLWGTKTYWAWAQARQRCTKINSQNFKNYGGRGITMCDRWLESFENFLEDMGECPEGLSLDREDNDGDYSKSNCRWVNSSIQGFNRRKDRRNTSGRTGVSFMKSKQKWRAYITVDQRQINLGLFSNFEDACVARESAEMTYFGKTKE